MEAIVSAPLQGTASAAKAIARVRYTHDAMLDLIIASPAISQGEIAQHFGFTQAWISRVFNSDAFQARLAARKSDLVDPAIRFTIEEKFKALADASLDIIHEKLMLTRSADMAFKAAELSVKALGYGARQANVNVQQNFVVPMPMQMTDTDDWAQKYRARHGAGQETTTDAAAPVDVESRNVTSI